MTIMESFVQYFESFIKHFIIDCYAGEMTHTMNILYFISTNISNFLMSEQFRFNYPRRFSEIQCNLVIKSSDPQFEYFTLAFIEKKMQDKILLAPHSSSKAQN